MGLACPISQLGSTILCEHYCWQKRDSGGKSRRQLGENRSLGKLSYFAASRTAPHSGNANTIAAGTRSEPNVIASTGYGGSFVTTELFNNATAASKKCMPSNLSEEAAPRADVTLIERDDPNVTVPLKPSTSFTGPSEYVGHADQPECPSNGTTFDVSSSSNTSNSIECSSSHEHDNGDSNGTHNVSASSIPSDAGEAEEKEKIRRFSLTESRLLKTLQQSKTLTPLEKINLEKILKFKITNDNLKGQLVIRAMRIEQLKDLENLLVDSYSELMWGPLTYRPALAWILSTYLRDRQAFLPNAVTLVGLYNPSEETMVDEESDRKWRLAGAVEISFTGGKPKDIQTPLPPESAPFLSNMAVLKEFRRRGIGRELLRAAEELALEMGSNEMYLHCRMIDEAPLSMYKSSGYSVIETDSILSLLLFQRRRHLMYKRIVESVNQD